MNDYDYELQLVTFEQAQRLGKAGFNWPCFYQFRENGDLFSQMDWSNLKKRRIAAPTVALALKWFRHVKGKHATIQYSVEIVGGNQRS